MQASLARAKYGGYDRKPISRTGARSISSAQAAGTLVGVRRGIFCLVCSLAAIALVVPAAVQASRKPTTKERAQIASVVHLPASCAKVRVSTTTKKPKWGDVSFKIKSPSTCQPLASDGVTIVHKSGGRWRFVTAGSSFGCSELYAQVPQLVIKDLAIKCSNQSV